MAKSKVITRAVYDVKDVMTMLDCSESYAYKVIKEMRALQKSEWYMVVAPAGKIEQSYFDSKVCVV